MLTTFIIRVIVTPDKKPKFTIFATSPEEAMKKTALMLKQAGLFTYQDIEVYDKCGKCLIYGTGKRKPVDTGPDLTP